MMKKILSLVITPPHMLRILLAIACVALVKAPPKDPQAIVIFQGSNGLVHCQLEMNAHGVPEDNAGLRDLLSKALGAPILEERRTQFALEEYGIVETELPAVIPIAPIEFKGWASSSTLSWADLADDDEEEEEDSNELACETSSRKSIERFVFTVDLRKNVPLDLLMEWNFTEKDGNFQLLLRSYDFYTATSMFREGDPAHFAWAVDSMNEVFAQYGLMIEIHRFIEEAQRCASGKKDLRLGEVPLQSYIRLCKALEKSGFVPGSSLD